jgi:purine nucleosidase
VLVDCDTGIDDALALLYLTKIEALDIVGISTVSGNTTAAQAAANTLALLALAGRDDIPVACGAADPLTGRYSGGAPDVHGHNGIGEVTLASGTVKPIAATGPELIVDMARAHRGALRLLTIGPLTNLALALRQEPDLPGLVADLTVMGGAALVPGNVSPVAEANISHDVRAAAIVMAAGWPVTLVGLDVTLAQRFTDADRRRLLTATDPATVAVGRMLDFYLSFYETVLGRRECPVHDPLAAAVLAGGVVANLAPTVPVVVDDTDGPGRGQTICDLRGRLRGSLKGYRSAPGADTDAHVSVVLEIDDAVTPVLLERILGP